MSSSGKTTIRYTPPSYGEPSRTKYGEWVKSKGEKQIADYFYDNKIKYVYEAQAKTTKSAFRSKISKPDFFLPDYSVYVEYWGLVDAGDSEDRSRYWRDMQWKKRQYYDNELKFISIYPWHLNDLDGAFKAEFKKVMGKELPTGAVGGTSVYALPVSSDFVQTLLRGTIAPQMEQQLSQIELVYHPYHFVEYDCFTQGTFLYERVNLESRGTLVLDGESGHVVDIAVQSGVVPKIQQTGHFIDCASLQQREISRSEIADGVRCSKLDAIPVKITANEAAKNTTIEIARTLSETHRRTLKNGYVSTKTIRPYASDVRIMSRRQTNIPIVTAVFRFKTKTYTRTIQAATNHFLVDDLIYCNVGQPHVSDTLQLCQECGSIFCKDDGNSCASCGKSLCRNHIIAKGLVLKKYYYCPNHVPQN